MAQYVKKDGEWVIPEQTYVKYDDEWKPVEKSYLKQHGAWDQISGSRNVANLNGVSQYAVAPYIPEIDILDTSEGHGFEIELLVELEQDGAFLALNAITSRAAGGASVSGAQFTLEIPDKTSSSFNFVVGTNNHSIPFERLPIHYRDIYKVNILVSDNTVTININDGEASYSRSIYTTNFYNTYATGDCLIGGKSVLDGDDNPSVRPTTKGQLRDIKIWTGGDRNTGTLTRYYRMDEGWRGANNQVLVNYATELGEEVVVNGGFDEDLHGWKVETNGDSSIDWTPDGVRVNTPGSAPALLFQVIPTENYLNVITINQISGGLSNEQNRLIRQGETHFIYRGNRAYIKRAYSGTDAYISKYSSKQADGYGTYIGLTEASWTEEEV